MAAGSGALGVYVHVPYCRRRCPYCDFNSVAEPVPDAAWRDAVLAELAARAPDFAGRAPAVSLYFGGGTPGLWSTASVGAVIDAVAARIGLAADAEITVEHNPGAADGPGLRGLRAAGVNRLSLGTQSFDDTLLAWLGRIHRAAESDAAIDAARAAGFEDLSLDLIQGAAGQSPARALADVAAVIARRPTHISTYQLTIAPETAFGARAAAGEEMLAPEDDQIAIFEGTRAALREAGYEPYEVSNAALPGREAVHNTLYWTGGEYLGLGAGAHGFRRIGAGGERYENERDPAQYLAAAGAGRATGAREVVDALALAEERLLTGLRLDRGVAVDADLEARFGEAAARLAARGWLRVDGGRWRATDRGRLLLDRLLGDLIAG